MGEHRYTYPVVVELRRMAAVPGVAVAADAGRHARGPSSMSPGAAHGQSLPAHAAPSRRQAR